MSRPWSLRSLLVIAALVAPACAAAPKRPPEAARRVKDSPAETTAAHRAAAPRSLELEKDAERWPIEAARERKRARESEEAAKASPAAPKSAVDIVEPDRSR